MIREFATKHMKSDEIKLDQDLNRHVWSRGKTNPPRKLRVKMVKDEDEIVTVSLYEEAPTETPVTTSASTEAAGVSSKEEQLAAGQEIPKEPSSEKEKEK